MKQSVSLRSNYDVKHDVKTSYKTPRMLQAPMINLHDNFTSNVDAKYKAQGLYL